MCFRKCVSLAVLCLLAATTAHANPLGAQSTLVLPVHFDEPHKLPEVQSLVNQADALLRWNSSGLTWLEPHYARPYRPRHEASHYRDVDSLRELRREALDAQPSVGRYRRIICVVPGDGVPSVGTLGYELTPCRHDAFYASTIWLRPSDLAIDWARVLLHELGHNFGFGHHYGVMDTHELSDAFTPEDRQAVGWPAHPSLSGR